MERLLILTPSYRWNTKAMHTASVARLTKKLIVERVNADYVPLHGCPGAIARDDLLRNAIATPVRTALWLESDIWWQARHDNKIVSAVLRYIFASTRPTLAAFAAVLADHRLNRQPMVVSAGTSLEWTGLGMVLADLSWFRRHWPAPTVARPFFGLPWVQGVEGRPHLMTDDVWHSLSVTELGGTIECSGVVIEHEHGNLDPDDYTNTDTNTNTNTDTIDTVND